MGDFAAKYLVQPIPIYGPLGPGLFHNRIAPISSFQKFAPGCGCCSSRNYSDRFIPSRRRLNFDAVRHRFNDRSASIIGTKPYLNVIEQMKSLHTDWKKHVMTQCLNEIQPFRGINSQRIFNFNSKQHSLSSEPKVFRSDHRPSLIKKSSIDDIWKAKSRCKPLLKSWESAVELSGYVHFPSRGVIDWSQKNMILVAVEQEILIFKDSWVTKCASAVVNIETENIGTKKIRCVKWSHAADRFLMYSESLKFCCYDVASAKIIWKQTCLCPHCSIRCVAWTSTDRQVITGCNTGKICIFGVVGSNIEVQDYVAVHEGPILDMAISSDDEFIATTGADRNIRLHLLKEMVPFLEIGYYDSSEALAWHPWERGILCIGGGIGDGSLSLWDVPKQKSLDYRRVNFLSRVKHLAWNNISGELVVVWYYWEGDTRLTTIPVLASWNRIADAIIIQKNTDSLSFKHRIANVIWNPHHTRIGIQTVDRLYLYNFFGDSGSEWEDDDKSKIRPAGRSVFDLSCIR